MKDLAECRLYAFVDTAYLRRRSAQVVARQLCEGGADLIQLRAKNSTLEQILELAELLLPITRPAGVGLVVNDHPALAQKLGAELCHLGQEDFFGAGYTQVSQLSTLPPSPGYGAVYPLSPGVKALPRRDQVKAGNPQLKIGLSTHGPEQAHRALAAGADYLAVGPVYATATKPAAQPVGLEYVRWAAANARIPWFAIGGISLGNLDEVLAAGARRICVVSSILNAEDIAGTCRKFKERL